MRTLEEIAARVEADELMAEATILPDGSRLVAKTFAGRDAESLKHLAQALMSHPQTIALLGSRDKETARLVFARSAETVAHMNALMKEACAAVGGRGGGKPDLAQGGGHLIERLADAISAATATVRNKSSADFNL